jgi:hypothetical protein
VIDALYQNACQVLGRKEPPNDTRFELLGGFTYRVAHSIVAATLTTVRTVAQPVPPAPKLPVTAPATAFGNVATTPQGASGNDVIAGLGGNDGSNGSNGLGGIRRIAAVRCVRAARRQDE